MIQRDKGMGRTQGIQETEGRAQETDEENFQDEDGGKAQENSHVTDLRQVDGGSWKDASKKKMEPSDYLMCGPYWEEF